MGTIISLSPTTNTLHPLRLSMTMGHLISTSSQGIRSRSLLHVLYYCTELITIPWHALYHWLLPTRVIASTNEVDAEYSWVQLQVLASSIASTHEYTHKHSRVQCSRVSTCVQAHMSCTRSCKILTCDIACHVGHSHSFVNLWLHSTVHSLVQHITFFFRWLLASGSEQLHG